MSDPRMAVIEAVRKVAGPYLAVFAPSSSVPVEFWAALTANESGGHLARGIPPEKIQRKEPNPISQLCLLAAGFKPKFSLSTADLIAEFGELGEARRRASYHLEMMPTDPAALVDLPLRAFIDYGSSWSFTQVMGYHALTWSGITLAEIRAAGTHYLCAARLMAQFCQRYGLDPRKDFEEMGRCWNTGRPDGICFDPAYLDNLKRRMELWLRP